MHDSLISSYNYNTYDETTQRNSYDNSWNNNRQQTTTTTTRRPTSSTDRRRDVYGNSNSNSNSNDFNNNNSRATSRPINNQGHEIYNQDRLVPTPRNYSGVTVNYNNNDYDAYNTRRTTSTTTERILGQGNNNNGRDYDTHNRRPATEYPYDSYDRDENNRNRRTTTERVTTTTRDKFYFDRATTKTPSYFQGDLPLSNGYETTVSEMILFFQINLF